MSQPSYDAAFLKAEIAQSPLGAALLAWLEKNDVGIEVRETLALPHQSPSQTAYGAYDPAARRASVISGLTLETALQILLHETRHAQQAIAHEAHGSCQKMFNIHANPTTAALYTRMAEIDADVFAVYFLYDHARAAGSTHFKSLAQMAAGEDPSGRARLCRVFDNTLGYYEVPDDASIREALLEVATLWSAENRLPLIYDRIAAGRWHAEISGIIRGRLADSGWGLHNSESARYVDTPAAAHMETLAGYTRLYARQLNDAGFPDYAGEEHAYMRRVLALAPYAKEIRAARAVHDGLTREFAGKVEELALRRAADQELWAQRRARNQARNARRAARRAEAGSA